jgi:hypothetical protein
MNFLRFNVLEMGLNEKLFFFLLFLCQNRVTK